MTQNLFVLLACICAELVIVTLCCEEGSRKEKQRAAPPWSGLWACNILSDKLGAMQAVVTLRTQYRMCADIMAIANEMTYEGRLRCGSPLVEQGMLSLMSTVPDSLPSWLKQASALTSTFDCLCLLDLLPMMCLIS